MRNEINQLLAWDGAPKQEVIRERSHGSNSYMDENDSDYGSEEMDVIRNEEVQINLGSFGNNEGTKLKSQKTRRQSKMEQPSDGTLKPPTSNRRKSSIMNNPYKAVFMKKQSSLNESEESKSSNRESHVQSDRSRSEGSGW